jgi:hypothetical protein
VSANNQILQLDNQQLLMVSATTGPKNHHGAGMILGGWVPPVLMRYTLSRFSRLEAKLGCTWKANTWQLQRLQAREVAELLPEVWLTMTSLAEGQPQQQARTSSGKSGARSMTSCCMDACKLKLLRDPAVGSKAVSVETLMTCAAQLTYGPCASRRKLLGHTRIVIAAGITSMQAAAAQHSSTDSDL